MLIGHYFPSRVLLSQCGARWGRGSIVKVWEIVHVLSSLWKFPLYLSQWKVLKSPSEIAKRICLQNPPSHNSERIVWKSFLNSQVGSLWCWQGGRREIWGPLEDAGVSAPPRLAAAYSICADGEPRQAQAASGRRVKGTDDLRQELEMRAGKEVSMARFNVFMLSKNQFWLCWVSCQKQGVSWWQLHLMSGEGWNRIEEGHTVSPSF